MKTLKVLFAALVIILSTSCQKEDIQPCNCGVVVDKMLGIDWYNQYYEEPLNPDSINGGYPLSPLIKVKNNCTSNFEWFSIMMISSYINNDNSDFELFESWEINYNDINIGDDECVYFYDTLGVTKEHYW